MGFIPDPCALFLGLHDAFCFQLNLRDLHRRAIFIIRLYANRYTLFNNFGTSQRALFDGILLNGNRKKEAEWKCMPQF